MNKIIIYSSFFLWLLFFLSIILKDYKKININKNYIEWLKKNKNKLISIPALVLIIIYIIFACFGNKLVDKIMFFSIVIYLFGTFICDNETSLNNAKFKNQSYISYLLFLFIIILPLEFYFLYHKLIITYIWFLLYLVFSYFILSLIKYIENLICNK